MQRPLPTRLWFVHTWSTVLQYEIHIQLKTLKCWRKSRNGTAKWDNNSKQWDKSYFQSLSELNWQSLQQRRTYLNQCQTFKVLNGMDCIDFAKYWSYSGAQQTRFWHACTLYHQELTLIVSLFFVSAPFLWNSLPANVCCLHSLNIS